MIACISHEMPKPLHAYDSTWQHFKYNLWSLCHVFMYVCVHNPVHIFMRPHSIFLLRNDVSQNSAASQTFFGQQLFFCATNLENNSSSMWNSHRHTLKIHFKLYRRISSEATRAWTSKTTCDLVKKIVTFFSSH